MILINSGKVSTMTSLHISCTLYLYSLLLGFQLHRNILEFLILASTSYTLSHFPFFVSSVLYPSNLFSFIFQPSWSMHLVFQGILFSSIFFYHPTCDISLTFNLCDSLACIYVWGWECWNKCSCSYLNSQACEY